MPRMRKALLAAAALLPCAALADGAEPVPELVRSLGADDFEAREHAFQRILDAAAEDPERVLPFLPADDPDPEVAIFLRRLRKAVPWERDRRRALAACRGDAKVVELVEALYRDITPEGVTAAAGALGQRQDAALPVLAPLLRHPDPAVRLSAVHALSGLKRRGTAERLLPLLRDPSDEVRSAAALGVGECGGGGSATRELVTLFRDPVPNVRSSAIMAFNFLEDRSAHPEIAKLLVDPDPFVRRHALEALGGADASLAPEIEKVLHDTDGYIQAQAGMLLARMLGKDAAPKLAPLLDSPAAVTQIAGIQIVGSLLDPSLADQVLPFVDNASPQIRTAAIRALAQMGARTAAARVAARLSDPDPQVRLASASALGPLGDPASAVPLANALLATKDPGFSLSAALSFIRLTGSPWKAGDPDLRKKVGEWLAARKDGPAPGPAK